MEIQEIAKYFRIIRKWWWVIVLVFGATVGTMLVIAFLSETQYEATVTVQVSAPPPQEAPLYSRYDREALSAEIARTRASFSELLLEGDIPYRVLEALPSIRMKARELRERTTVEILENSQLMRIHVRASEPETAALLANTLVETGLERYGQLLAQPTASTRRFIEQEMETAQEELKDAETELEQFKVTNKIGDLDSVIRSHYDLIRSLKVQRDLAWARGDMDEAQTLEKIILEREIELQDMIGLSSEYNELVNHVTRARATYNYLSDRKSGAQIKENQILELSYIQIITPALAPQEPVPALTSKLIVLGAVASLLAGGLLTFLLEYMEISGVFREFQRHSERPDVLTLSERAG